MVNKTNKTERKTSIKAHIENKLMKGGKKQNGYRRISRE